IALLLDVAVKCLNGAAHGSSSFCYLFVILSCSKTILAIWQSCSYRRRLSGCCCCFLLRELARMVSIPTMLCNVQRLLWLSARQVTLIRLRPQIQLFQRVASTWRISFRTTQEEKAMPARGVELVKPCKISLSRARA